MILKTIAAELEAIAIGKAYAVLKKRIPGNVLLQSMAVTSPRNMLTATTMTTKIRVTVRLFQNEEDYSSS